MDESAFPLAEQLIGRAYAEQGRQALRRREGLSKALLSSRRLPLTGWDDASIEFFMSDLALMDSNNFIDNVGVGEREGRVYSPLVAKSRFRMSHGMGRSGDIAAVQPKAAGSSLMVQLVNLLALDAMRLAGLTEVKQALCFPTATGMTLSVVLLGLRLHWKTPLERRVVLWSRIDQKSCFKAIVTAGFQVVVAPLKLVGDALETDLCAMGSLLQQHKGQVFCVVTTTSCFAPRCADDVEGVARLLATTHPEVGHVVNNAYGLQCAATMKRVSRAMRVGRVDVLVQSTDKNFLVPVGGAVVAGADKSAVEAIGQAYPGRASSAPIQDLFITLLSMGATGYQALLKEREELVDYFKLKLNQVALAHGERVLETPLNRISFGITLDSLGSDDDNAGADKKTPPPHIPGETHEGAVEAAVTAASGAEAVEAAVTAAVGTMKLAQVKTSSESGCGCGGGSGCSGEGGGGGGCIVAVEAAAAAKENEGGAGTSDQALAPSASAALSAASPAASMDQTYLGSMLFTRCVSGTRVVRRGEVKALPGGVTLRGFGSSFDAYPHAYLTAACALGTTKCDVDRFAGILDKSLTAFKQRREKERRKATAKQKN